MSPLDAGEGGTSVVKKGFGFPILFLLTSLITMYLVLSCSENPTGYDLSDFEGITSTDAQGKVITVDPDDWCMPSAFVGTQLFMSSTVMYFRCDSVGQTVNDTIRILNFGSTDIVITGADSDPPTYVNVSEFTVPAGAWGKIGISFTLPDSNLHEGEIEIGTNSSDGLITLTFNGKGNWGAEWAVQPVNSLSPAYPNPASTFTLIRYGLASVADVELDIIDSSGARVKRLIDGRNPLGSHTIEWHLDDSNGTSVAPGLYRCVLKAGGFTCYGDIQVE